MGSETRWQTLVSTTSPCSRPLRWRRAALLFCCLVMAMYLRVWYRTSCLALVTGLVFSTAEQTPANNAGSQTEGYPWQYGGPSDNPEYWFSEFQDTLDTMQNKYWNGTYWPTTIQWIGAFLNTLVAASDISFTKALENNATVNASQTEIERYFSQIEAYYDDEDSVQIFGAAYDDAQWVVLEWLEVIKLIDEYNKYNNSGYGQGDIDRFSHRAHIFYNIVQNQFNTSVCEGGITWNPALATYKNAITNELFMASSIAMYLYFPGDNDTDPYPSPKYLSETNMTLPLLPVVVEHDQTFLDNAINEYQWFKTHNFTNAQGLIVDGFHVSVNQSTCDERNEMVYTYNQGVILSGLRGLWEATGDPAYLADGYDLVATVINATGWNASNATEANQWSGLGRNGIMEDYCDAPANCSQDAQIFKGIYFHHLDLFCEPLPTSKPLVAGVTELADGELADSHAATCQSYAPWIKHNADAALSTRTDSNIIGGWWGASYANRTQSASPDLMAPRPQGSWDEWNDSWVLSQSPWACDGLHGCRRGGRGNVKRMLRLGRRYGRRDVNDGRRGRTVETQGSGLGVVKAASDFSLSK